MQLIGWFMAGVGYCLAVVLFEAAFHRIRPRIARGRKKSFCAIWWALLAMAALASGLTLFLFALPFIFGLAASHIDLAGRRDDVVTLASVLGNIPAAVRDACLRLRPFLK